jgi:glycosyltransferase involved in cell wall biosynthesis
VSSVVIVSHAYSETSLQGQVSAIGELVDVTLIAPETADVLLFKDYRAVDSGSGRLVAYRKIRFGRTQFLLKSFDLGFQKLRPRLVHIDYDPWLLVFWQVRLAALLFASDARVVIGCKKNTFRAPRSPLGRMKRILGHLGFKSADGVLASSLKTRDMITEIFSLPRSRVLVTSHVGVDTTIFSPSPRRFKGGLVVIGYCGRLEKHKGVPALVRAVEVLVAEGREVLLRLLGTGGLKEDLAEKSGSTSWLQVLDEVPTSEVPFFMHQLDIYVLAAEKLEDHEEHDAHALLQAMACGLAVVGSDSGIIPEVISEASNGLVIESGREDQLVDALRLLIEDDELRQSLRRNAYQVASARYSYESVARAKVEAYRSLSANAV